MISIASALPKSSAFTARWTRSSLRGFKGSFQEFAHYAHGPQVLLHRSDRVAATVTWSSPRASIRISSRSSASCTRTPYGVRAIRTPVRRIRRRVLPAAGRRRFAPRLLLRQPVQPQARPKWKWRCSQSRGGARPSSANRLQYENAAGVPMIRRMADFTAYPRGGPVRGKLGRPARSVCGSYSKFGHSPMTCGAPCALVVDSGCTSRMSRQQQSSISWQCAEE